MENSITHQQNTPDKSYTLQFGAYTDIAVEYLSAKPANITQQKSSVHQTTMSQSLLHQAIEQAFDTFQEAIDFLVETVEPEKIFVTPDFQENGNRHLIIVVRENDHSTFEKREKLQDNSLLKRERITL